MSDKKIKIVNLSYPKYAGALVTIALIIAKMIGNFPDLDWYIVILPFFIGLWF